MKKILFMILLLSIFLFACSNENGEDVTTPLEENESSISEDEIELEDETVEMQDFQYLTSTTYVNEEFGFSLEFPESWSGVVGFDTKTDDDELAGAVNFIYAPVENIHQPIFSIRIYQEPLSEDYKAYMVFEYYIGENDELDYTYSTSGEPEEETLKPENSRYLEQAMQMVNEEVPVIMDSFQFIDLEK